MQMLALQQRCPPPPVRVPPAQSLPASLVRLAFLNFDHALDGAITGALRPSVLVPRAELLAPRAPAARPGGMQCEPQNTAWSRMPQDPVLPAAQATRTQKPFQLRTTAWVSGLIEEQTCTGHWLLN